MKETYYLRASRAWSDKSVYIIATPSPAARNTFFYVQEIGHFFALREYFTERERLHSYLIVYTESGRGNLTYRGKKYKLTKGHAFYIDCQEYQYYEQDGEEPWEILWVHFNGIACSGYFNQFTEHNSPVVEAIMETRIPDNLRKLLEMHKRKEAATELVASQIITDLLTELLLCVKYRGNRPSPGSIPAFVEKTVELLDKRYAEKITLNLLAEQLSVNKFHLLKQFKNCIGFTPSQYLINIRITEAKGMLIHSNMSVEEVAHRVGFEHVSHFIGTFKKQEGATPLAFRQMWQQ
jgi:AraC-like DNA-binding protein